MLTEILILIAVLVAWAFYADRKARPPGFPPGPASIPMLGSVPFFGADAAATFQAWKRRYGPAFGFNFARFQTVMLNDPEWIKEAYEQDVFAGRPALPAFLLVTGGRKVGLTISEGRTSTEQRRFALRRLREFGFGKKSMEGMIHEDVERVLAELKGSGGEPLNTAGMFSVAVLSSLWQIIAGDKPSSGNDASAANSDEKFKERLDALRCMLQGLTFISPKTLLYSWLAKVLPTRLAWLNPFTHAIYPLRAIVGSTIEEHKRTFDPDNPRDFIDVYLQEMRDTKDPSSSFFGKSGDENLLLVVFNLLAAGAETTSNSINWAILLLSLHPKSLHKVQTELDAVIGRDRLPGLDDRANCPYTEAVIHEVFRYSSIVPFGIFHNTMAPVRFHGYNLPKDTMVMANALGVHYDPAIWGDPENFRPERHLSPDGASLVHDKPLYAFSVGKRACLGEALARNEFFLFLTAICQRFDFCPNPAAPKPDPTDTMTALFRFPKPFEMCFTERPL